MDIQGYIDSGIIEEYCLGLLNHTERAAVARNAAIHEEIRSAINEYEQVLKRYAEDWPMRDNEEED